MKTVPKILLFVGLTLLGMTANVYPIPLAFGLSFILGTIPVFLILEYLGLGPALLSAAIVGGETYLLWNHPYAAIIVIAEILFVGLLKRRTRLSIVLLDAAYWLPLGGGLVWLFYHVVMASGADYTYIVFLKQTINGIFNALIAGLLVQMHRITGRLPRRQKAEESLYHGLVAAAILPALAGMVINAQVEYRNINARIRDEFRVQGNRSAANIDNAISSNLKAIRSLAGLLAGDPPKDREALQRRLALFRKTNDWFHNVYVADSRGVTLAFDPEVNERGESNIGLDFSDRGYFRKLKETRQPVVSEAILGRGGVSRPIVTLSVPIVTGDRFSGYLLGAVDLDLLRKHFLVSRSNPDTILTVVDSNGKVVISTADGLLPLSRYADLVERYDRRSVDGMALLEAKPQPGQTAMERWRHSYYRQTRPLDGTAGWRLDLLVPVARYQEELYRTHYTYGLTILYGLLYFVVVAGRIGCRRFVAPLERLAQETTSLPEKIFSAAEIAWPRSRMQEVDSLIGNFREVSETLKEKVTALQESEGKFKSFAEQALTGIYLQQDGRFRYVNPKFAEIFGYSVDECIEDLHFSSLVHPDDLARVAREVQERLSGSNRFGHYFFRGLTKGGRTVHIEIYGTTTEYCGRPASIGTLLDITARTEAEEKKRVLEEQVRQAQKMEAIGTLAGGIAHDFNNLLTTILGYAELMKRGLPEADPQRKRVENILAAGERATALTSGLLAYSRKESLKLAPVSVNEILTATERLLSRIIGEDVELVVMPAAGELNILADAAEIEHLLMNLATNARDAMPDGGTLFIGAAPAVIDAAFIAANGYGVPGDYALVTVSDTGCGMDEETRARIFEPFFTTKEVGRGTGLGLAIVYGIVMQHDGFITAGSEPGKGTTFRIYLPLSGCAPAVAGEQEDELRHGSGETILVIEDSGPIRELLGEMLREFGYRVLEAEDGEAGLEVFRQNRRCVDLLLIDVVMPKMNGKETYDAIREVDGSVRAIFMSGYANEIISRKGIDAEGLNFVSKPVTPAVLLRKIRDLLGQPGGSP